MGKIKYLEGLRGLAAFIVVIHHFVWGFFPGLQVNGINHEYTKYDWIISQTPINLFYAGNFSVCIFFVLSGYVLSYKFFKTGEYETVISSAFKRYIRLEIPVLFSISLAYLVLKSGFFFNQQIGLITHSTMWLSTFYTFKPSFINMLTQATYGVFFKNDYSYNTNLWTMQIEFYGSFIVFVFLALFGKIKKRLIMYFICICFFGVSYFNAFILGMLLSDLVNSNNNIKLRILEGRLCNSIILFIGLFLGSLPLKGGSLYEPIIKLLSSYDYNLICHVLGAFLLVTALTHSLTLQSFFSNRIMMFLGKISFSLYIIHLVVICSFSAFLLKIFILYLPYKVSVILMFVISIILLMSLSFLTYRYVDRTGVRFANFVYERFFKKENSSQNKSDLDQQVTA